MLFGDSYTAGDGVSIGHRYGDLLEAELERAQVLNFGLPGSGTDQQYLAFREFAAALDYDLLIISPMVENIRRILRTPLRDDPGRPTAEIVRRAKPYFERVDGTPGVAPRAGAQKPYCQSPRTQAATPLTVARGRWRALRRLPRRHPQIHCLLQRSATSRDPIEYERADEPGMAADEGDPATWIG